MIDEVFLKSLGFSDFTHLRKSERDGKERLACTVLYHNFFLTILLLKQSDNWIIDKLIFQNDSPVRNKLFVQMYVEELITKVFNKQL